VSATKEKQETSIMESMNGQSILNGQGHLKGNYIHEDRSMKNGSTGSNSSEYRFYPPLIEFVSILYQISKME
jgi:hypothetical protein